jgi:hypothetical protein
MRLLFLSALDICHKAALRRKEEIHYLLGTGVRQDLEAGDEAVGVVCDLTVLRHFFGMYESRIYLDWRALKHPDHHRFEGVRTPLHNQLLYRCMRYSQF